MINVIPRYFTKNKILKRLSSDNAFGGEFRVDTNVDFCRYSAIATSHALIFILNGEKVIHNNSGDTVVNEGECVFIPKGSYMLSDVRSIDNMFKRLFIFFEDSFLQEFLSSIELSKSVETGEGEVVVFPFSPFIENIIETLPPYLNDDLKYGEKLMKMKLHEILLNMVEQDSSGRFYSSLKQVCSAEPRDLRSFMKENVTRPLTVAEFANLTCRSSRQFSRDFREIFKEIPSKWIRKKRLEYAHNQIHVTGKSLSDICCDAGFQNYSNFIQLFRQQYNITPKQLQKQI